MERNFIQGKTDILEQMGQVHRHCGPNLWMEVVQMGYSGAQTESGKTDILAQMGNSGTRIDSVETYILAQIGVGT